MRISRHVYIFSAELGCSCQCQRISHELWTPKEEEEELVMLTMLIN